MKGTKEVRIKGRNTNAGGIPIIKDFFIRPDGEGGFHIGSCQTGMHATGSAWLAKEILDKYPGSGALMESLYEVLAGIREHVE